MFYFPVPRIPCTHSQIQLWCPRTQHNKGCSEASEWLVSKLAHSARSIYLPAWTDTPPPVLSLHVPLSLPTPQHSVLVLFHSSISTVSDSELGCRMLLWDYVRVTSNWPPQNSTEHYIKKCRCSVCAEQKRNILPHIIKSFFSSNLELFLSNSYITK